ncbi:outer membrane receptor protein involved in Fe transport [Litorivivens lipolytica]|uniref:Outer membrane receptor protein involved in Fe transport n=1 Tax=Litorivivens lipolytica TaxID=1524264 RepID=A0A7W4W2M0_9GAMM|nr:TonB-dependent receptor [Litorivivens lipolytica]MBB3046239.1 outer membrane receptor protein involved in Fe transport [Litorivivens lipolytica]
MRELRSVAPVRANRLAKLVIFGCLSAASSASFAAAVLEEVVVTAQLREQSLQDVPVSVSAISGDKMMEAGLSRIEDLQAYVPNFTMSESGIGTDIYIRGIGSGENQGFEQSVGMYVDGISYGRAQLARAPFLDLSRVEVLRGPQNILLGKNSIAGAINISTAKPTQEFEGYLQATWEGKVGERILDGVLSGPITDTFAYRFATRIRDYDGHIENLVLGNRDEPNREERTYRLKFLWDASDDVVASLKLEHGSFDVVGRHSEIIFDSPSVSDVPFFSGRTYGEILNDTNVPGVVTIDSHPGVLNVEADYKRHSNGDTSDNNTQNITLNVDWYRDGSQFSFITGYMAYDYDEYCDCDFTGGELFQLDLLEDYKQFSQEFRWISPVGESWEYIAGAYLHYSELYFYDSIRVDSDIIPDLVNAADATEGGARGDFDPGGIGGPEEVAGIGDAGNAIRNFRSPRDFHSDSTMASAFMQATWNVVQDVRLTFGGRLTWEKKEGSRKLEFAFPDFSIRPIGESDTAAAVSFAAERHDLEGKRIETQFAPLINVQWDFSDDAMAYFTASRGFKSGGFDARSNASPSAEPTPRNPNAATPNQVVLIGTFEYEEEEATSYELGVKSTLFGGVAELNAALFRTEFDDLQVSVFDGTLGFNVGNAASAISQGLELDGRVGLTENLMLMAGLAFLDFEFVDHLAGTCIQGQTPNSPNGINCDYSGKTNQYVADYSGNILLAYERPVLDSLIVRANVDAIFTDEYHPSPNLDDRIKQDGYVVYNARLALSDIAGDWEVALLGKNLSDEVIIVYGVDAPTAYTITEAATHHGFVNPPRTVALQFSYRW